MKYIYSQLLALIKEEYSDLEIAEQLFLEKEDLSALIYDKELDVQDIFDKEDLDQWATNHGFDYSVK
jgi:hypothetical protein